MRQPINISLGLLAFLTALNLSGCIVARDDGSYHSYGNDHGDLVIDNDVRYVGWCGAHVRDPHCHPATTVASEHR